LGMPDAATSRRFSTSTLRAAGFSGLYLALATLSLADTVRWVANAGEADNRTTIVPPATGGAS
jgi:hypothetical protein